MNSGRLSDILYPISVGIMTLSFAIQLFCIFVKIFV